MSAIRGKADMTRTERYPIADVSRIQSAAPARRNSLKERFFRKKNASLGS
jgi:hypothetical protein